MGISERREREKAERRSVIVNSVRELILSQGIEQISMEDVARKAELSKATVYLYFPSKNVLFREIGEEAARFFLERLKSLQNTNFTGIKAMKFLWRSYTELFGNSKEMIIIFKIHSFLNPGLPFISLEECDQSPSVNAILEGIKAIIDQCKAEGDFDPGLDSDMATRMLLTIFSNSLDAAARMSAEIRKSPAVIEEMTKAFQLIIYGFAKEGIDRSCLDLTGI